MATCHVNARPEPRRPPPWRSWLFLLPQFSRRSPDGRLQPFKLGLGLVLDRRRVPVVPVVIRNTYAAWPRSRRLPRLRSLRIDFLPIVQTAELAAEGAGDTDPERIIHALQRRKADALKND